METIKCTKFNLGRTLITPGALHALKDAEVTASSYLQRHASGDWGDVMPEDREDNEDALRNGGRLFSAYRTPLNQAIWVVTDAERSMTTVFRPEEY
jgi:hypothetical protein